MIQPVELRAGLRDVFHTLHVPDPDQRLQGADHLLAVGQARYRPDSLFQPVRVRPSLQDTLLILDQVKKKAG
ncbi:MAG TPA: hypothetical protein VNO81_01015 [Candidatus Nitrosotenuis sp.]|nr:hypothetical protein [Candidatus Nitrosotenuis sp.]